MKNACRVGFICLLFFILIRWNSYAQNVPLRFEHLTVNQGLANNVVYAMLQDSRGYMWFATDNGLNKYDGYTFTTYKKTPGETTSLTGNSVIQLLEDKEGHIWVGMMGQGICKFNRHTEKFTCYGPDPHTLTQGTIHSMTEDQDGYLWVCNRGAELRRFDKQTGQYSRFNYASLLAEKSANGKSTLPIINSVYRDKEGTIWVCSAKGLHQMHVEPAGRGKPSQISFTTYRHDPANPQSLSDNWVWEVYEDHARAFWVSTHNGLNRFDRKTGTFTRYREELVPAPSLNTSYNGNLGFFAEDQQGNLWMGTYKGLVRLNPARSEFTYLLHDPAEPSSISGDLIRAILVDQAGLLWISLWGDGIDRANIRQQPFQHYRPVPTRSHSLSNKYVNALLVDRSGTLWIGTSDGLNRMNKRAGDFTHYRHDPRNPKSLPNYKVTALLEDRDGNLWVSCRGELALFNRKAGEFSCCSRDTLHYPGLGGNTDIFTLYQDRQGLIWLGTSNGVKSFNPRTGNVVHYAHSPHNPKGISDYWALSFLEDNRGNLWMGTGSVALNRLDRKSGRFTHFRPDSHKRGSITSDNVPSIFQDSKGNLWFGTYGGGLCLFNYETETFRAFTQADGLPDNSIQSIEEDKQGNLWLATSKGISRFSLATKSFSNFDVSDGLQISRFGRACSKGQDGMLYFGGDHGFNAFDPGQLRVNRHVPPVVITQVKLFDKPLSGKGEASKIDFNYDENFFSFEFAALSYTNPSKNRYAYRLEGLEKHWVYSGSRRYASYTNLNPGTYTFRVKGSNNDGIWNEKGASIEVVIHPPWWQTDWFRLLFSTGLALGVGVSLKLYTKEKLTRQRNELKRVLQAQEEERQRLAADLHDDLGATLSVIKGQLEYANQHEKELTQPISLMKKAIRDLRHISHNLMPPDFAQLGLSEAIEETVRRVDAGADIQILFITHGQERRLDNETELTIYRIAIELINNAVKHANARKVTIQLMFYPNYISLLVEDDGKWYPGAGGNNQAGIGLRNIRSRVAYLNSKFLVDSGERGTTITLEVPL
ncbi:MAG: signal transduction histidine kinase [Spirosoma sp.]|nr:signal transduction histidine kinase [Spirosoma sp.]